MSNSKEINAEYQIPKDFYERIEPYIREENRSPISSDSELVAMWEHALQARKDYPEYRESIAEWTMSAGANSPIVNNQDLYEAIHNTFGELEFDTEDSDRRWGELEKMVGQAKASLGS